MNIINATWHTASHSQAESNCVETAYTTTGGAAIRDTKNRDLGHLTFSATEWTALVTAIKNGEEL